MKKISILLPSRKRIEETKASIDSLFDLAKDPTFFEVCARIDADDRESVVLYERLAAEYDNIKYVVKDRGRGYVDMNLLFDDAMTLSDPEADYVYVWGNDTYMLSQDWDRRLFSCLAKGPAIANPSRDDYCFPIVSKRWFREFNPKFPNYAGVDVFFYFASKYVVDELSETGARDVEEIVAMTGLDVRHDLLQDKVHREGNKKTIYRLPKTVVQKEARDAANRLIKVW